MWVNACRANASAYAFTLHGGRAVSIFATRSGSPKPYPNRMPGTAKLLVSERRTKKDPLCWSIRDSEGSASSINASSAKRIPPCDDATLAQASISVRVYNSPVGLLGLQTKETYAVSGLSAATAPASRAESSYSPNVGEVVW